MDTNILQLLVQLQNATAAKTETGINTTLITQIIIGLVTLLGLILNYLRSKSADENTKAGNKVIEQTHEAVQAVDQHAKAANEKAEEASIKASEVRDKIHVAVNSGKTILDEKVEKLEKIVLDLTEKLAVANERLLPLASLKEEDLHRLKTMLREKD